MYMHLDNFNSSTIRNLNHAMLLLLNEVLSQSQLVKVDGDLRVVPVEG